MYRKAVPRNSRWQRPALTAIFAANPKAACDHVCEHHEPLLVERRSGGDVVLLSKEDFDLLEEMAYLLRSPENARRLLEALSRSPGDRKRFAAVGDLGHEVGI